MKRKEKLSGTEKRLETLALETEKQKKALVAQLRKTPVVQLACERLGIGRSTYYEWRTSDHIFGRAADEAIEAGRFFINDIAESRLMNLVQQDNITGIIFWLKHNHPKYAVTSRVIHEYIPSRDRLSTEEEYATSEAMTRMMVERNARSQFSAEEIRKDIEEQEQKAELNKEDDERLRKYLEE